MRRLLIGAIASALLAAPAAPRASLQQTSDAGYRTARVPLLLGTNADEGTLFQ